MSRVLTHEEVRRVMETVGRNSPVVQSLGESHHTLLDLVEELRATIAAQ